jgi:hypothetical protein
MGDHDGLESVITIGWNAHSKLKTAMRKGAARTVKALWRLIGRLIKTFAPEQCVNYFRHAGYGR